MENSIEKNHRIEDWTFIPSLEKNNRENELGSVQALSPLQFCPTQLLMSQILLGPTLTMILNQTKAVLNELITGELDYDAKLAGIKQFHTNEPN